MGETRVRLKLYGVDGEAHELVALVDTGSTFCKIPESLASSVGSKAEREVEIRLANGRSVRQWLGQAEVELGGKMKNTCNNRKGGRDAPHWLHHPRDFRVQGEPDHRQAREDRGD